MLSSKNGKTFVIAEAGVNHNGDLNIAKQLIRAAREAGADAVKFQTFKAESVASAVAQNVGYQKQTVGKGAQVKMLEKLEISEAMHRQLIKTCKGYGIIFLSTPFDHESVDLLARMNIPTFKVPSGEITNQPLLEHIATKKRPIILSTGMASMKEVARAVKWLRRARVKDLTLLHCVTEYPAPFDQVNLRAMLTMKKTFDLPVGLSDHTPGIWMSIAATALGAVVIEKHLTLDKKMQGPDHRASLEPAEFKELVKAVRAVEVAMGDGIKKIAKCEKRYVKEVRKSLVASREIKKGQKIALMDIAIKRPGKGIMPDQLKRLQGRITLRNIRKDQLFDWGMFE